MREREKEERMSSAENRKGEKGERDAGKFRRVVKVFLNFV